MIPITAYYIALAILLAIPSDRAHRICLGGVILALVFLYGLAALVPVREFYIAQTATWLAVAFYLLWLNNGWKSIQIGSILLVVAGVSVFPAWLEGLELVPFTSLSLMVSGCFGVGAIIAFGFPGLRRAASWLWGVVGFIRGRGVRHSLRDS